MIEYLISGIVIGLSAGIAPGPLMTLIISQTLHHGFKEGVKVALAPFITDIPIIIIIMSILSIFKNIDLFLGTIALLGATFLLYLAYESFKVQAIEVKSSTNNSRALRKGILTNALNPSPYLFYFTVGGTFILKALNENIFYSLIFVGSFLGAMFFTKVVLAFIVEKSRNFLKSTWYRSVNWFLGLLLMFYAFKFLIDGLRYIFK